MSRTQKQESAAKVAARGLAEAERVGRDLQRMQELDKWPRWPWLPMKRPLAAGAMPELACMHADHTLDGKPRIYHVDLYQVGWLPAPDAKFTEYENLAAILADGWRID